MRELEYYEVLVINDLIRCKKIDEILRNRKVQLMLKRIFDIVISLFGLLFLLPFFLIISIAIRLDSKGTILYKQVRIGKCEKEFVLYKFRTMVPDAEKNGMQITVGHDKRITQLGYILRKYKIDELPQLFNVFLGDMSFVGPRPEVPKYVSMYNEAQKNILKVRPGITDIASIEFLNENTILTQSENPEEIYIEKIMPLKIKLNIKYIINFSIFYDIKLIMQTIHAIIKQN